MLDNLDNVCGYLYADVAPGSLHGKEGTLLVLSQCYKIRFPIYTDDLEEDWNVGNIEGDPREDLFWVMLMEWMGDVWERRGIGQVTVDSIQRSLPPGPRWERIILG